MGVCCENVWVGSRAFLLCVSVNALLWSAFPVQLWIARLVIQQFYLLAFLISIHSAAETLLTDVFLFWSHRLCNRKYVQTTTLSGTLAFHRWLSTNLFLNIFMTDAGRKWFHIKSTFLIKNCVILKWLNINLCDYVMKLLAACLSSSSSGLQFDG